MAGGGFAGAYVARELGDRGATIVSKENFMLYTPLLPEAASGTLTCAMHLWQYDARTGKGLNPRGTGLRRLPMKLEDDGIWIEVDGDAAAE